MTLWSAWAPDNWLAMALSVACERRVFGSGCSCATAGAATHRRPATIHERCINESPERWLPGTSGRGTRRRRRGMNGRILLRPELGDLTNDRRLAWHVKGQLSGEEAADQDQDRRESDPG